MYQTNYVRAKDTNDAVAKLDNEAKVLAGGMTLIPTMKHRLASPETLVDLADCGLAGIEDLGNALKVGAMTRHVDVGTSKVVWRASPRWRRLRRKLATVRYETVALSADQLQIMTRRHAILRPLSRLMRQSTPATVILPLMISLSACLKRH